MSTYFYIKGYVLYTTIPNVSGSVRIFFFFFFGKKSLMLTEAAFICSKSTVIL